MPIPAGPSGVGAGVGLFLIHACSVETFSGSTAYGPAYSAPVDVACFIDDEVHMVRDAVGNEVASSTTVFAALSDAAKFSVESRVTINGRTAMVIAFNAMDSGPLGLPDHVEVHLT